MGSTPALERTAARFDGWLLLRQPLELFRDGQRQRVQDIPLRLLEMLVSRPGELVTRDELSKGLWPGGVVEFDANLNTALRKLRAVLGDDADAPRFIETVPRRGYRFIGTLEARAVPTISPTASAPEQPIEPASPNTGRRKVLLASLATCAAVIGGTTALWLSRGRIGSSTAPGKAGRYRIAVLPFDNLSPDPANAFFADGIHEEVLSTLASRALDLDVISRATMMTYRSTPHRVSQIVEDLGATHVLEGTVRRAGDHVRVTLRLVDAAQDKPLWAETFDRELGNAMSLQMEIAEKVAGQLAVRLAPSAPLPPSHSPEAHDLWLKGVLAWQNIGGATWQEVDRVEAMFTHAIDLDSAYVAAYADRARVRIYKFSRGGDVSEANIASARADIAMAQKLGGRSAHVLMRSANLAMLIDGDVDRALALIAEAERAGPLTADYMMTKAQFLLRAPGRLEESIATHERAARLDPANPGIFHFWTMSLFLARRPREALRVARRFDERFPGRTQRGEGLFAYTGATDRWREELATRRDADPLSTLSEESDLLRYEGRTRELAQLLDRVRDGAFRPVSFYGDLSGAIRKPVATLAGWLALLQDDRAGAARAGAAALAFAQGIQQTEHNAWWLRLLLSEAALFRGDTSAAIASARATLDLAARWPSPAVKIHLRSMAARIFAWADAKDESVELLEQLSKSFPTLGPAAIVRDPLMAQPLARQARYVTLSQRLEAEIAANQSLL